MENLKEFNIPVNGITIHGVKIGEGEPFLLLHGHPESCRMWHKLIPELSRHFTVVAADLRGYGDSGRPEDVPDHSNYSKEGHGGGYDCADAVVWFLKLSCDGS